MFKKCEPCEQAKALNLEVWADEEAFQKGGDWWEIRWKGVCIRRGGGSDEAPDAALASVIYKCKF